MALVNPTWIEEAGKDTPELLKAQNHVLELIARGESLPNVLDALLRVIEGFNPGLLASVLLLDSDGVHVRHAAAPSLPKSYLDAINGLAIGPCAGSCGTAAYRGEPVIVEDIARDPLWDNYRDLALRHGLRACWSTPIFDEEHRVLGTFALYFRSPGMPTDRHRRQIAMVTHTASIAIMRDRERESLIAMNKRLTLAMAAGQIAIWERDVRTNRFLWSSQLAALLGRSEEDEIERFEELTNAVHKDDRRRMLEEIEQAIRDRSNFDIESRVVWPDGSVHWLAARGKPYFDTNDEPAYIRCAGVDITQRKRVQEEIKRREIQLGDAQRVAHFGSYEWRPDTNTVLWTDELFRIFGLERDEFIPTFEGYLERVHPDDRAATRDVIERCARERTSFDREERILRPDGNARWLFCRGQWLFDELQQCDKLVGTCQDITTRKEAERSREQMEEQLRHAQKMESVGRLAGGVAHDFNNLLSVIVGHLELAREKVSSQPGILRHLTQIAKAADRAAALTRHLLAFSRRDVIQPSVLDLNLVVTNLTKMMSRLLGEQISLRITTSPLPAKVKADLGQIDQIVMNLAVNAVDAMPKGGKIFIEMANVQLDENVSKKHPLARAGDYVMLSFSDTGCGMSAETISHIFEPYFTTKPAGQGTGLGLSMVHGSVEQNGGFIDVYSHLGKGTTFKIYFPSAAELPIAVIPCKEETAPRGWQTILVVEDDEELRQLTVMLLESQGYKVMQARDGASAVAIMEKSGNEIHLVLTDVVLPDLNGVELVQKITALQPRIATVYMSGYPGDLLSHHGVLDADVLLLPKPFTKADLISRVSAALRHCQ